MSRRSLALACLIALAWGAAGHAAAAERRVALVIGNARYQEGPLKNPVNDARAMAARLAQLGFEVTKLEDATRDQMGRAVGDLGRRLTPGSVALLFYAGHGIQSRGRNYLIPVDAAIEVESDLRFEAVEVAAFLEEIEQAQGRVGFVILDACRNNPFERRMRGGSQTSGLAAIDAARGLMIAYATAPGSVAADGDGQNGVYTAALLKALDEPGLKAEDVFKRVRVAVSDQTRNRQIPWESSALTGDFVFHPGVASAPAASAPASADREALFWQSIHASANAADFEAYLAQFPRGTFASLARNRLEALKKPPQVAAVPAPAARAIEPIDREYIAKEAARLRESPDLKGAPIAVLRKGEAVLVLGKVRGQEWYQVEHTEHGRKRTGFVAAGLLEDAATHVRAQVAVVPPAAPAPVPARLSLADVATLFDPLRQAIEQVHAHYVEPVDDARLLAGAAEAIQRLGVAKTQGPARNVAPPRSLQGFHEAALHALNRSATGDNDLPAVDAAVKGALESLDPHSSYINAKQLREVQTANRGEFGGLGIEVAMEKGAIKVVAPVDDTPAARAGLLPGDLVTHLDGASVDGFSLQEAVDRMRGPVGSTIRLTVRRKDRDRPFDLTLMRATIKVPHVRSRVEGDVGYVRISAFNDQTLNGFELAVAALKRDIGDRLAGYVIDLRNNPGGLLDSVVAVSDALLDGGEIMSWRGRNPSEGQRYAAKPGDATGGKPIMVLINRGTSSGAEIFTAALQDHRRAAIVGSRSFGKGSLQTLVPLAGGGAVKITTAYVFTPSGRKFEGVGIEPDVVLPVEQTDANADLAIAKAVDLLRARPR